MLSRSRICCIPFSNLYYFRHFTGNGNYYEHTDRLTDGRTDIHTFYSTYTNVQSHTK